MQDKTSRMFEDNLVKESGFDKSAANKNPAQAMADEILSVVKKLQDLEITLAKLPSRKEIAQTGGLVDLHKRIDDLFALADQYRLGGVSDLSPKPNPIPSGDPDKIREQGLQEKAPALPATPAPKPEMEAQPELPLG